MEIAFERPAQGQALVAHLAGELDLHNADELRRQLDRALTESGARDLIVDLAQVPFIDSSGLGVLLGRYRNLARLGGRVALTGAAPNVVPLLELSGLQRVMLLAATPEEALTRWEAEAHERT